MSIVSSIPAAERLRRASAARVQAEIDEAVAIADLAAEHSWTAESEYDMIGTRLIRIGADGTRLVNEFLALEVAALKSMSVTAATWLIRDIINLQARHPMLWAKTLDGTIPVTAPAHWPTKSPATTCRLKKPANLTRNCDPKSVPCHGGDSYTWSAG